MCVRMSPLSVFRVSISRFTHIQCILANSGAIYPNLNIGSNPSVLLLHQRLANEYWRHSGVLFDLAFILAHPVVLCLSTALVKPDCT